MTTQEALFKLLRIAIGTDEDLSIPADVNLTEVLGLSESAGVNGFTISGIQRLLVGGFVLSPTNQVEKQRLLTWIGLSMVAEQKSSLQWKVVQQLVELYAQKGIITVGLKGITVAQWYPNPMLRDSCDFDCFLLKKGNDHRGDFAHEEGNRVVEAKGVHVDRNIYVHSVFDYQGLTVENHQYLAAVKLSKRHWKMDAFLRKLLVEETLQPVMDTKLMMGSPMFNAVFLTHHAHRHFLNEYMSIKQLMDWALFIDNNPLLEWKQYQEYVDEFGMLRFAQSMTRLAGRLMGATIPFDLPEDTEADELLEDSLWEFPVASTGKRTLFSRRVGIIGKLMQSRKKYKVFYDISSLAMIVAYIRGYLFGKGLEISD